MKITQQQRNDFARERQEQETARSISLALAEDEEFKKLTAEEKIDIIRRLNGILHHTIAP